MKKYMQRRLQKFKHLKYKTVLSRRYAQCSVRIHATEVAVQLKKQEDIFKSGC